MSGERVEWEQSGLDAALDLLDGPWQVVERLPGTGGGSFGSVVSRLRRGDRHVVVKVIRRNDVPPDHPAFWRRELEAHRSEWLADQLPEGLMLPELLASAETDHAAVLVLDDLDFVPVTGLDALHELAGRLGHVNATPVVEAGRPPWLSSEVVLGEARQAGAHQPSPAGGSSSVVGPLIDAWRPALDRIGHGPAELVELLDRVPSGLHHLDVFSRNATALGDSFALIDWALLGLAPIGSDAAGMIAVTVSHGDVDVDAVASLRDAVVSGYLEGVSGVRPDLDPAVLLAVIDIGVMIRFARFLVNVDGLGVAAAAVAEEVAGRPIGDLLDIWGAAGELFLARGDAALRTLDAPPLEG